MKANIIYIAIGVCLVVLLMLLLIWMIVKNRRSSQKEDELNNNGDRRNITEIPNENLIDIGIKFDEIAPLSEMEESELVEISDKKLVARIDGVIPGTLQAIANAGAIHNYNEAVQEAGQLYRAIIPKGAVLANSRDMKEAVRGIYHGNNGIKGHANLVEVDGNLGNGLAAVGSVNAVMNVASMVVGQYYMTQINDRLDSITNGVDKISNFQDMEFRSKVYALVAEVHKSATFQVVIMENDELRNRELTHLKSLEHECAQLLGQANLMLEGFTKETNLDYDKYEKQVAEANTWFQYQQALLEIMGKISELTYALNLGAMTKESCYSLYYPYANQAQDALNKLNDWHQGNSSRLEIDVEGSRRKRKGFNGFIMNIPALFVNDLHYKQIPKQTAQMISNQTEGATEVKPDSSSDLFQEDVELIAKDGKLYYLPPT